MSDPAAEPLEIVPLPHGRYLVKQGTTQQVAFATGGPNTWVFLGGRAYRVGDAEARRRTSRPDDHDSLIAPMPATVLAIHVSPGERVERHQVVMVLEAMKMELPIRSPRDGLVKAVGCRIGELVQPGTRLVELGDEPTSKPEGLSIG